jgi:hypothetical protein
MRRYALGIVIALSLASGQAVQAQQSPYSPFGAPQPFTPYPSPLVSPYLNLLRGGNTAFNYFYYVRPQIDFTKSFQEIQKQVFKDTPSLPATGKPRTEDGIPSTGGRMPGYFTHQRYFQTQGTSNIIPPRDFRPVQPGTRPPTTPAPVKSPYSR